MSGKSSFLSSFFFSLRIRFEHKRTDPSVCHSHFRSKALIVLTFKTTRALFDITKNSVIGQYLSKIMIHCLNKNQSKTANQKNSMNKFCLTRPFFKILNSWFFIKAGIPDNQLDIALEPEAASIYCHLMNLDEIQENNRTDSFTRKSGVKYMVVDLGGKCLYQY